MATRTLLHIYTKDAQGTQGYTERVTFGVTPASFGATTLPAVVDIEAAIASLFGNTKISSQIVYAYSVEVIEDAPGSSAVGGNGAVATAIAAKARNQIGASQDPDGWELRLPGLIKSNNSYDPTNANSIVTSGTNWTAAAALLVALGFRDPTGVVSSAPAASGVFQTAVVFNGKRAPKRPR